MRFLGVLLLAMGATGVGYGVNQCLRRGRPADVAYALLAWVSVIIVVLGLALIFVPGFLG